jgi:integrase
VPRRRGQKGRVFFRGKKWVGRYREAETDLQTGSKIRRTITFGPEITSRRAAEAALQPYLDRIRDRTQAMLLPPTPIADDKKLCSLIDEWKELILPNRKLGGGRACLSHIRTYLIPLLGENLLRELTPKEHQAFVTAVGRRVNCRRTTENVYCTLTSILKTGRKWGYRIPEVRRQDIEFLSNEKPKTEPFFFDSHEAAQIINAAPYPFKLMFLIAAICGLRIGEVTALKVTSLDFKRKLIHITAALDYTTRKESTPKSANSAAPLTMTELLELHLRDWIEKRFRPNPSDYLFINSKGRPYLSDNVVKYGIHKTMDKIGIPRPRAGVHVGIHCFRHGVTTELLQAGTPIHLVTRMMRHGDAKVTLNHYAHVIADAERVASENLSRRIGAQLRPTSGIGPKVLELDPSIVKTA